MARDSLAGFTSEIHYRRGAIMGLTVAEAFMLVAFALLMLLVFWRHEIEDEYREARELTERFSPEERAAIADPTSRDALLVLLELQEKKFHIQKTAQALLSGAVPVASVRLAELETRARLVEEGVLRQLVEAAAVLPPEHKRTLSHLVALPDAKETIEKIAALQTVLQKRRADEIADALALKDSSKPDAQKIMASRKKKDAQLRRLFEKAAHLPLEQRSKLADLTERFQSGERSVDEVMDALALRDNLDPYGEYSNEALKKIIQDLRAQGTRARSRLAEEKQARKRLLADLQTQLGAQIAQVGGRIEATGKIVVPDTVVFTMGQDEIRPRAARFLGDFCPRWLATLKESRSKNDIAEIRIEGHSSSEWTSAPSPREAWLRNLDLSQRRAQSVLDRCLNLVERSTLGSWARGKLTAVGYSSSRPVLTDGSEDQRLSRRVVFGTEFSRERLLKEIRDDLGEEDRDYRRLEGVARVKDADTIEIRGRSIRLDGIDGLEKDQICERPNGSEWPCGREASRALAKHLNGRSVVCEKLRLDLRRYNGRCRIGDEDLNRWVVKAGWAFAYVKYSKDYLQEEKASRAARRGAWMGKVDPPWEWRKTKRTGT